MTDATELRAFALEVATKAAKNTTSTVGELLHRTKARAYLHGKLSRRFPDVPDETLREVVQRLKLEISIDDPEYDYSAAAPRTPVKGREKSTDPAWSLRADQLAALVAEHGALEAEPLLQRAAGTLRWRRNFAIQTLAAAETLGLLEWREGLWELPAPDLERSAEPHAVAAPESPPPLQPAQRWRNPVPAERPIRMTLVGTEAPAPAAPAAPPTETPEERRKRKRREWNAKKRSAPKPPPPPAPAAPAVPLPAAASADSSLDALLEQRVKQLVAAEVGTIIQKLITKALVAA